MASPAPARVGSLHPADWIRAAIARLAKQGVQEVRVEVLARDLGATKGSFYWHFRDRAELLEKILAQWEKSELAWLGGDSTDAGAANKWAELIAKTADPARIRIEIAIRAWARSDGNVAARVAAVEEKRAGLIAEVLRDVGFSSLAAESWSRVLLLVCLGWMERTMRDPQHLLQDRNLGELLSEVVLAASARSASTER
jgi:AcrR family transcriptional regulator